MKQIKSQQYSSTHLATLFAKNFSKPSEASGSTNANSFKTRVPNAVKALSPDKENEVFNKSDGLGFLSGRVKSKT